MKRKFPVIQTLTAIAAALTAVVVLTSAAKAEPSAAQTKEPSAAKFDKRQSRFPVSVAEISATSVENFTLMDANGDAVVSFEEFSEVDPAELKMGPGHHRRSGPRPTPPGPAGSDHTARQTQFNSDLFERLDLDGDGMLSAAEFSVENQQQARHDLHQQRMFARLDSNDDQVLTLEEMPGERLILKDLDGDGQITRSEMRSGRPDNPIHPSWTQ